MDAFFFFHHSTDKFHAAAPVKKIRAPSALALRRCTATPLRKKKNKRHHRHQTKKIVRSKPSSPPWSFAYPPSQFLPLIFISPRDVFVAISPFIFFFYFSFPRESFSPSLQLFFSLCYVSFLHPCSSFILFLLLPKGRRRRRWGREKKKKSPFHHPLDSLFPSSWGPCLVFLCLFPPLPPFPYPPFSSPPPSGVQIEGLPNVESPN